MKCKEPKRITAQNETFKSNEKSARYKDMSSDENLKRKAVFYTELFWI